MGQPTLEEFRRWLQTEISALESTDNGSVEEERLLQLDIALQEAMHQYTGSKTSYRFTMSRVSK